MNRLIIVGLLLVVVAGCDKDRDREDDPKERPKKVRVIKAKDDVKETTESGVVIIKRGDTPPMFQAYMFEDDIQKCATGNGKG